MMNHRARVTGEHDEDSQYLNKGYLYAGYGLAFVTSQFSSTPDGVDGNYLPLVRYSGLDRSKHLLQKRA